MRLIISVDAKLFPSMPIKKEREKREKVQITFVFSATKFTASRVDGFNPTIAKSSQRFVGHGEKRSLVGELLFVFIDT